MWLIYHVQVYSKVIQLYAYVTLYYINILFQIFYWKVILFFTIDYYFLLKLLQDVEYSFLCYTVGPCCFIYFICSIVYLLIPSLFFKDWFLRLPFVLFFPFNLKDNIIVSVILGRKGDTNTHPQCHQIIMLLSFFLFYLYLVLLIVDYYSRACPRSPPLPQGEVCFPPQAMLDLALWLTLASCSVKCTFLSPYFAQSCDLLCFCFGSAVWDPSPLIETKLLLPPVAAWSLNHWTSREVPDLLWQWDVMMWAEAYGILVPLDLPSCTTVIAMEKAPSSWAPGQTCVEQTWVQPTSGAKTQMDHSKVTQASPIWKHVCN